MAIATVCFLLATGASAELCDKGDDLFPWGSHSPEDVVMLSDVIHGSLRLSIAGSLAIAFCIFKRWIWFGGFCTLLLLMFFSAGLLTDPNDRFIQGMILEGCQHPAQYTMMMISSGVPLLIGAVLLALGLRTRSQE